MDCQTERLRGIVDTLEERVNHLYIKVMNIEKQIAEPTEITKEEIEEELGYKINIVQEKTNG